MLKKSHFVEVDFDDHSCHHLETLDSVFQVLGGRLAVANFLYTRLRLLKVCCLRIVDAVELIFVVDLVISVLLLLNIYYTCWKSTR